MKNIPFLLIYSRAAIAFIILGLAYFAPPHHPKIIVALIILGLITDVFDGIIARKLGVASEKLRQWDSNVDQLFWLATIAAIIYMQLPAIKPLFIQIIILLVFEALAYLISFFKFKRTVATHSLLAKIWTLTLLIFLTEVTLFGTTKTFWLCFWVGLVSRLEICAILLFLKEWTTDVPSIFAVPRINRGEKPKKRLLF